jgi:hypothetical protein
VDTNLLDKYVEQIRDTFAEIDKKSWKMSASITGPAIESSRTTERVPLKAHEKIDLVQAFLETQGDLLYTRPETTSDQNFLPDTPRFVLETMIATKVVLPLSATDRIKGLSSVAVWISDPDPKLYSDEPYDWRGTFVYLSELHWDNGGLSHFLSGVSALQVIVNLSTGKDFFDYIKDEFEPFGRGRDLHPVDKLKEIGGVVMDKRKVRSLYRIRYLSNEQTYNHNGQKRRVNDLLGYPLYISSES